MIELNKKNITRIPMECEDDLTGLQVILRIKNEIEDTSAPIIEELATIISISSTLSTFYFDVDLTGVTTLNANFYYEVEINDGTGVNDTPTTPPQFNTQPEKGRLITRLRD